MKPYGQGDKTCHFWSKVDHHILKCKNWWEGARAVVKGRVRQKAKIEIKKETEENARE